MADQGVGTQRIEHVAHRGQQQVHRVDAALPEEEAAVARKVDEQDLVVALADQRLKGRDHSPPGERRVAESRDEDQAPRQMPPPLAPALAPEPELELPAAPDL